MKMYNDTFNDFNHACLNPCSFVTTNTYVISDDDFIVRGKETMSFININVKKPIIPCWPDVNSMIIKRTRALIFLTT